MTRLSDYLKEVAGAVEINLLESQVQLFEDYYRYLVQGNEKCNLTAITEPKDVAIKHFIDSLNCLLALNFPPGARVLDVGTGAGFPGIPLKIYRNDLKVTLMDSLHKRILFLRETIHNLGLNDTSAVHDRAEDFGHRDGNRENYEIVVSRAVARLSVLAEYCLPCVKVGGYFISQKGPDIEGELEEGSGAFLTLGGRLHSVKKLNLPLTGDPRSIIIVQKIKPTPKEYPRKAGTPAKKPLK